MKKCIVIPDSFKGSMSAMEACRIIGECVRAHFPACSVVTLPVADGGEGTVDCFYEAIGGQIVSLTVKNPFLEDIPARYLLAYGGDVAIVEAASCIGLPLVEDRKDPCNASTYGVGQMIAHALKQGCRKIILGLGGSSTNDGGAGMAAALGVRFYDEARQPFLPVGGTLDRIAAIDISGVNPELYGAEIIAMCDVDNPLCGENGASHIYGPQKGADAAMVRKLDKNLGWLDQLIQRDLSMGVGRIPGAGAAGGLGAGVLAFLKGRLEPGIQLALEVIDFESHLKGADMVFTGEGKLDSQSLHGKVVMGVSQRAKAYGIPVIALVGAVEGGADAMYDYGLTSVFPIARGVMSLSEAYSRAGENLRGTVDNVLRTLKAVTAEQDA